MNGYLKQKQSLPLDAKITLTRRRIKQWHEHWDGDVHVSFSGGKDSTVLLHIVRDMYPDVAAVFVDTGLEFPEIRDFVKTIDNVVWLKPKMSFKSVIDKYGWPVISKDQSCAISRYRGTKSEQQKYYRLNGYPNGKKGMISKCWQFAINAPFKISDKCCDVLKKSPLDAYEKSAGTHRMEGTMACESNRRATAWEKNGCNAFGLKHPSSRPLSVWMESDIWEYIKLHDVKISKIYDMGYERTGCMFCGFGAHLDNDRRFDLMKKTHPAQYKYIMETLGMDCVLEYIKTGAPHE